MATTYEIHGHLIGGLWWPSGALATKPASYAFSRDPDAFNGPFHTLREAVESLMRRDDGDFQGGAMLTADSYLVAVKQRGRTVTQRFFDLAQFGSIADYMSEEFPLGEDDYR